MRLLSVCARLLVLVVSGVFCTLQHAAAQEKYFQITDDGLFYFFNEKTIEQNKVVNGENTYTRPITARTFFLEAQKAEVFPKSLSFTDFQRMSIAEKQQLLDSLQHDYDWAKFRVNEIATTPDTAVADAGLDTIFTVQNLAYNKEGATLYGDLVSGTGKKQKFMVYPIPAKTSQGGVQWVFEWIELDLFLKKQGYRNLDLPEIEIYKGLLMKGIDMNTLNALLNQ